MRKSIIVALAGLIALLPAAGQERKKLSGAELQEELGRYHVNAGTNPNGCAFMVVNFSPARREQYFDCFNQSGTAKGSARVDGDKLCTKWDYRDEQCNEVFRIGEHQYETIGLEGRVIRYYRLK